MQPAHPNQHVDRTDRTPLGESGFHSPDDASFETDRRIHFAADSPSVGQTPSGRACRTAPVAKKKAKARVPGTTSVPVSRPADPRAMEGMFAALGRGAVHYAADEARFYAQDLMYDAFEAQGARRVALAREALAVSPDCADAYLLLAEETAADPEEALELLEQGVAAGERALGLEPFENDVGYFWGLIETRPYMRARAALAETLWALGRHEEAVEHQRELLRLNPNDNQGVRDRQAEYLLALERYADLDELFAAYEDDAAAAFVYTKALAAFRRQGDSPESRALLAEAREQNAHVPAYLSGRKRLPARLPDYIGFGDPSEAVDYAVGAKQQWESVPGALAWIAA
jgi:tetratricopeptide (TPR) repeat protein